MKTNIFPSRFSILGACVAVLLLGAMLLSGLTLGQSIRKDSFNHLTTGFPLTGVHQQAKCETCHVQGIFKGTPKDCLYCHGPSSKVSSVTMTQNHIPVTEKCDTCHTTQKFYGARFNHASVTPGNCTQCHNGVTAPGKPASHIVTTASCDSCHRIMVWLPATFNHASVAPGSCAQCHNGSKATGKSSTHLLTAASCDSCHSTTSWIPATKFDHVGVVPGTCTQCHNGINAPGQKPNHVPTSASCDSCHTPGAWLPARFDHASVLPGSCAQCHNGKSATGMKPAHIPTAASCDSCHRTTAWKPTSFSHKGVAPGTCAQCHNGSSATGKPAKHLVTTSSCDSCHNTTAWLPAAFNHTGIAAGSCAGCHNGTTATGMTASHIPTNGAACDSCHSKTGFTTFAGTGMNHAAVPGMACTACHESGANFFGGTVVTRPTPRQDPNHPLTGDCIACHTTTSFGGATSKPANHIPTTQACALCHSNPADYSTGTMNHQGITSGCATCHGPGLAFANVAPKSPPVNHIPVTGIGCEGCHSVTNFTSFASTKINHAAVPGIACATCHETGKTWFGVTIVTRPTPAQDPIHPKTGDCAACHTTLTFAGAANKPANHIPTTQACALCHSNPQDYKTYSMNHRGIAGGCATCHGPGLSFATNFVPKAPPATHIPTTGIACESCHTATQFTSFSATLMNHASSGAIACATCHETGKTWFGITTVTRPTPTQDPNHPKQGTGDDCAACHTTTSFNVATAKPVNHLPTTQACTLCHSNPANFKVYAMNHSGIAGNCAQCHGPGLSFATNFVPKAPPATHIPTSGAACESCHSKTNFTSFSGTPMNHTAVSAMTCATCHETGKSFFGVTIVTRPTPAQDAAHPTTGDCGACHTTTPPFKGTTKPANHIPTSLACNTCHTTSDYSKYVMSHQGIASNCAQCHGPGLSFATNFVPKAPPVNHIPTNGAACEACHSPSKFTSFAGTPMNHTPVSGIACATCHETGKTFFGVTIVTRPTRAQDAAHPATGDCGACHTTTPPFTGTTKPANHIPTTQPCALCHTTSDYSKYVMNHQGIANNCKLCHGPGLSFANIVPKAPPSNHIPYTAACESCHLATNFTTFASTKMNHTGITTNCAQCHGAGLGFFGTAPKAPPAKHIPYSGMACEACHTPTNYTSWGNTKMNHTAVSSFKCTACHETGMSWFGVQIEVRPNNHHVGQECNSSGCHSSTTTFSKRAAAAPATLATPMPKPFSTGVMTTDAGTGSATPMGRPLLAMTPGSRADAANHASAVPGGCLSCHNGRAATMKPAKHIPTTLSCDACHRTTTWVPANFRHTGVVMGTCATCHNGALAKTKPAKHVLTMRSCDTCHRTQSWVPTLPGIDSNAGVGFVPMPKPGRSPLQK